ncbi:MAG: hypothetical protein E7530_08760 [Ruminococcaceae bacterium]|nr:hypothetical protein [Oscillospiraceae bacterium]
MLNSIPSDDYAFNAIIELYLPSNPEIPFDTIKLPFDVSLLNEVQTRMCSFKNDIECEAMISIYADGNVGEFIVDNIRIYKATPEDGAIAIPGVSTSDPIATTITDIGQIKRELITDGTNYMLQEYDYTSDCAKAIGVNDFNGISTYFDYTGRTEILSEKGYAIDSRNLIVDPIVYDYNRAGLLQYVSQTVNSVTGEEIELLTEYTYDSSERITSVSNNNYCYNFTYDDIGNITNINKETVASETPETNNLIDYTYANNNIGIITYSNGYKLEYSYNENGEITNITGYKLNANDSYDVVGSYTYTYSNGRIAETVISSCDLSHDVKIKTTDTSIAIYYLQGNTELVVYSKEKRNSNTVETFISSVSGSNEYETLTKTPITEITVGTTTELYSEFHSEKRSLLDSGLLVATDGSNNVVTDYFGRIVSKYSTLEANAVGSTSADSLLLGLTNNYTYKELTPVEDIPGIRTSNLIESITNASKILSETGSWDYLNGRNLKNMGIERIASNLFARCVGNYAESAVNRVNATWGDGWIVSNRNSAKIIITELDSNADKYMKIWLAAPSIKSFATAHGIYITL